MVLGGVSLMKDDRRSLMRSASASILFPSCVLTRRVGSGFYSCVYFIRAHAGSRNLRDVLVTEYAGPKIGESNFTGKVIDIHPAMNKVCVQIKLQGC